MQLRRASRLKLPFPREEGVGGQGAITAPA